MITWFLLHPKSNQRILGPWGHLSQPLVPVLNPHCPVLIQPLLGNLQEGDCISSLGRLLHCPHPSNTKGLFFYHITKKWAPKSPLSPTSLPKGICYNKYIIKKYSYHLKITDILYYIVLYYICFYNTFRLKYIFWQGARLYHQTFGVMWYWERTYFTLGYVIGNGMAWNMSGAKFAHSQWIRRCFRIWSLVKYCPIDPFSMK